MDAHVVLSCHVVCQKIQRNRVINPGGHRGCAQEVHKDVAAYTVGGTRLATDRDWIRVMRFYNIDLLMLKDQGLTRNGGPISRFFCRCKGDDKGCHFCETRDPKLLLLK